MRKRFTWFLAVPLGVFHLIYVMGPVIATRGTGDGAYWRLMIFDYPLVRITQLSGLSPHLNILTGILLFALLGTAMYAAPGALIGYAIDRFQSRGRSNT